MRYWIFQAVPQTFDLQAFLDTEPSDVVWLVNQYVDDIASGDRVFLWLGVGKDPWKGTNETAGVYALGEVIETPNERMQDEAAMAFWRDPSMWPDVERMRVNVRILSSRTEPQPSRAMIKDDCLLRDMSIMKFSSGTNFALGKKEADRLVSHFVGRAGQ